MDTSLHNLAPSTATKAKSSTKWKITGGAVHRQQSSTRQRTPIAAPAVPAIFLQNLAAWNTPDGVRLFAW